MDNKKQLIIIPPMSEALKKLHEVLEGISGDENMEISLIDDLKELSQFLGTTGQCLILASNAKKCATFLQENKSTLAKHHCKTILFTPKEIPAKTLIKFTKIGLTESILESSPPKTFLFKVKLLLRSIKTAKAQEEGDKVVKSLEAKAAQTAEEEREIREKEAKEENVIDMERPGKKKADASEETIDYGNPLKGKVKPQEETIDTHWKSNRKKTEDNTEDEEENMAADSAATEIDMYYRGKQKKADTVEPEEDDFDTKMAQLLAAQEEEEKRRKSNYADVIDEGSIKQKRLDVREEEEAAQDKIALVDLDLIQAEKKKDTREDNLEEELDLKPKIKSEDIKPEEEKKKKPQETQEDLGGYLKGKITQQQEEIEEDFVDKKEVTYDNSDVDDEEEQVELDLIAAEKKKDKKNNEEESDDNSPHEGEVDQIEGNMIGDAGTVDKIRTRMEGRSSEPKAEKNEEDDDLDLNANKKTLDEEDEGPEQKSNLKLEPGAKEKDNKPTLAQEEEKDLNKKASAPLPEEEAQKERPKLDEAAEKERLAKMTPIERLAEVRAQRAEREKREEKEREKKAAQAQLDIQEKKERQTHTGQVDKIDTFYRGGESKKKDQNWDNLADKKTELDLIPGKTRRAELTAAKESKDLGEVTIDYKKLKEEFDMISSGGIIGESGAIGYTGSNTLRNDEDEGSFKVVEIDPKSLDFAIAIVNTIYQKDIKPKQIFAMLAEELLNNYHCFAVFSSYKLSDKKFSESYNTFLETVGDKVTAERKEWWMEKKKDSALFEHFQTKSMTTWRCPEIIQNNEVWEDVELPAWAEQELGTKAVELIFPYFDGVDRMGLAVVFFPEGIKVKDANGILTTLEMARTLFLDTIQRYQVQPIKEGVEEAVEAPKEEKKNVLSFFGGLFGKKKAG